MIAEARKEVPVFRNKVKQRQCEIENRRKEDLAEKKKAIEKKRNKNLILYCGLWQNAENVQISNHSFILIDLRAHGLL